MYKMLGSILLSAGALALKLIVAYIVVEKIHGGGVTYGAPSNNSRSTIDNDNDEEELKQKRDEEENRIERNESIGKLAAIAAWTNR